MENPSESVGILWDYSQNPPKKQEQIFNNIKINKKKFYIYRRKDKVLRQSKYLEIITNSEQIQYLKWVREYGENNQRITKWIATWKVEVIQNFAGYIE